MDANSTHVMISITLAGIFLIGLLFFFLAVTILKRGIGNQNKPELQLPNIKTGNVLVMASGGFGSVEFSKRLAIQMGESKSVVIIDRDARTKLMTELNNAIKTGEDVFFDYWQDLHDVLNKLHKGDVLMFAEFDLLITFAEHQTYSLLNAAKSKGVKVIAQSKEIEAPLPTKLNQLFDHIYVGRAEDPNYIAYEKRRDLDALEFIPLT